MKLWIPLVLEQNIDPVYSECRCPKCEFESVHHMGVPCQHYSCPRCGEIMQRLEEPKKVKESIKFYHRSNITKLPDGSGFFTATIGTKKKKKHLKESELIEVYLTFVQDSKLQEVTWKGIKDYFTKERPQPQWVQQRIKTSKVRDKSFAQKVLDRSKQQRLTPVKVGM
jgi:hypothetical protein